ncbi:MAG: di-heme oxidoredictase family protein [Myxococcota bacterium]
MAETEGALNLKVRDEADRMADAIEPGEMLGHAQLMQQVLDQGSLLIPGLGAFDVSTLFAVGDELFDYAFRPEQGLGNGLGGRTDVRAGRGPAPNLRRVHEGEFGGPDSHSCSSCHSKGGLDGAGTQTQNAFFRSDGSSTLAADERNPPLVMGLGPIQALAREMSQDLLDQASSSLDEAAATSIPVAAQLSTKGVSFGSLVAHPDGTLDVSGLEGVDPDMVVKPFGWKGHQGSLRRMIEESFRIHMGVLSMWEQRQVYEGQRNPADYGNSASIFDVDEDGTLVEIEDGMLTTMEAYLSQLSVPVIRPPQDPILLEYFGRGRLLFEDVQCHRCHVPALELENSVVELRADLTPASPVWEINVATDGETPKISPILGSQSHRVELFSDLKRHNMGAELATPVWQGNIPPSVFLTRPLWGLAETAPYLHDGRAPTVHDAIMAHGGESAEAREHYSDLGVDDQKALQVFLLSLSRAPALGVP